MPGYKVGIEYQVRGLFYVDQDAESEEAAVEIVNKTKEDFASKAIAQGNGELKAEVCDVIPNLDNA